MDFLSDIPPAAIFAAVVGTVVIIAGILFNLRWALASFAIMAFAASISYSIDPYTDTLIPTLFTPVQLYRNFIYMFGGGLCYLAMLAHAGKLNATSINQTGLFLIGIAVIGGAFRILNGYVEAGLLSLGLAVFSIIPLTLIVPNLLERREQVYMLMRWVLLVMGIWIIMNTVQFLVNPGVLYPADSGRFQGLTGNPQFAAVLVSFSTVCMTWVALNDPVKIIRIFAVATAAALAICLVWTGSRTGFGMAVIGLGIIFASRIGQLIWALPVAGIFAVVFLQFVSGEVGSLNPEQLFRTNDTRSSMWGVQIETFLANPLFGTGNPNRAGASENSYLLAFSAFGIFMGTMVLAFMVLSGMLILKLFRNRKHEDRLGRSMSDLAMAGIAMYFAGALLEGCIMSRVHSATVYLVITATIGHRLLATRAERLAHNAEALPESDTEADYHEDESVYLPDSYETPQENVWDPEEDWDGDEYAEERLAY